MERKTLQQSNLQTSVRLFATQELNNDAIFAVKKSLVNLILNITRPAGLINDQAWVSMTLFQVSGCFSNSFINSKQRKLQL